MVVDKARGPVGVKAGLVWHLADGEPVTADHFRVRKGDASVEVRLIPLGDGRMEAQVREGGALGWDVRYWGKSELRMMTVFSQ